MAYLSSYRLDLNFTLSYPYVGYSNILRTKIFIKLMDLELGKDIFLNILRLKMPNFGHSLAPRSQTKRNFKTMVKNNVLDIGLS